MSPPSSPPLIKVCILALPESMPAALFGLYEVFTAVGVSWPQLTGEGGPVPRFDVSIVSADGRVVEGMSGAPITPHAAIGDIAVADLIVVADLDLMAGFSPIEAWPEMAEWIRRQYGRGAILCSVCTGSVLLAAAGVLDHQEATTHWSARQLFRSCFPEVILRPERIVVPAGDGHRIVTSGGASSWEDLALYLIARLCGEAEAIKIAKVFLFGDRSEGQMLYAAMGPPRNHDDAIIAEMQSWVAMNYQDAYPVARMVSRSGLAARTFKRRFKAATGYSPMDYVQTLRIEEAKQILETTDTATDDIARIIGYEDPTFFRRLFKKRTGVTPGRYRQRFGGIAKA